MKLDKSIKFQLITFVSLLVLFLLFLMVVIGYFTIKNKYKFVAIELSSELNHLYKDINDTISLTTEEIRDAKENELKSFLENSTKICDNLIKTEIEALYKNIKIISEKENVQNAISFNLFRDKSLKKVNNEHYQRYISSEKPIKYISLLNTEKTFAWPGRETRIGLEMFDSNGIIKARTDLKKDFREKDNSKEVNIVLKNPLVTNINKISSTKKGLIIKVYSKIINPKTYRLSGGLIATFPIDNTFINYIKESTNCEVIVFKNHGEFDTTTLYSGNERYHFSDKIVIFDEIKNNPSKIVFEDMLIKTSPSNNPSEANFKTYKFIYYPIINNRQNIIGMIALGVNIADYKNIIISLIKDEENTFNKFDNLNTEMLNNVYKNGKLIITSYIYIITIIMILGGFIALIFLDTYIKKILLTNLNYVTLKIRELSNNPNNLIPIDVIKNDEVGLLVTYFNELIDNLNRKKQRNVIATDNLKDELQKLKHKSNENIDNIIDNSLLIDNIYIDISKKRDIYLNNHENFIQKLNYLKSDVKLKYENIKINLELLNNTFSKLIDSKIINSFNEENNTDQVERLFNKYNKKLSEEIHEFDNINSEQYEQIMIKIKLFHEDLCAILLYLEKLEKVYKINNNIHYDYVKNIKHFIDEINEFGELFK